VFSIAIAVLYGGVGLASLAVGFWQIGDCQLGRMVLLQQLGIVERAAVCNVGRGCTRVP